MFLLVKIIGCVDEFFNVQCVCHKIMYNLKTIKLCYKYVKRTCAIFIYSSNNYKWLLYHFSFCFHFRSLAGHGYSFLQFAALLPFNSADRRRFLNVSGI